MATHTSTTYSCEKCGVKLPTSRNELNIVTRLSDAVCWSRLHVQIVHRSGIHNASNTEQADLCRSCAIELLKDALGRVNAGERASKGTESSEQRNWEGQ